MNNTSKMLVAVIAGASVGAVLGVLFAPDKGSETRRKIRDRRQRVSSNLNEKLTGLRDKLDQRVREKMEEFS